MPVVRRSLEEVSLEVQREVEQQWQKAGILSAPSKSVVDSPNATELGAHIGGAGLWIGASGLS